MDKQVVSRNLFKKLSALRATLTDEEQELLDSLLLGEYEISAHGMTAAKTTAKISPRYADVEEVAAHGMTAAKTTAKTTVKATDVDEVAAHALTAAKTTAKTTVKAADVDEVAAHGMKANVTERVYSKASLRVIFDEDEEVYTIE